MELEVKVMWCKGVTAFNFFQKLSVYASVSIAAADERLKLAGEQAQEQRTPADEDGGGNPEWFCPMRFALSAPDLPPADELTLLFRLRHQGAYFGAKDLGEVLVPLRDLLDGVGLGVGRFVSYEVRSPDGKHNGVLDFSYKTVSNGGDHHVGTNPEIQITGYDRIHHHHHHGGGGADVDQCGPSDGPVQYPRIDEIIGGCANLVPSAPPLFPAGDHHHHHHHHAPLPSTAAVAPPYPPPQWASPPPPPPYVGPGWGYHGPPPPQQQPHHYQGYEYHRHW